MQTFDHDGQSIAYVDRGDECAPAVLLIHGFASNHHVNWEAPGWFHTLTEAGYRVVAHDNRGHGRSSKPHDPQAYHAEMMADDAAALLDHRGIARAHVMGYSMGARIAAFMALRHPRRVRSLVLGGLGIGLVSGVGEWDEIARGLLAGDPASISDPRAFAFRKFADQTASDRVALAACISTSRALVGVEQVAHIVQPTLVAVGTRDDIGGDPHALAALMPNATAFDIENRDHMLAVGDRSFKKAVLAFLGNIHDG
jgi:pimeloyl-ACP methyl ester carboxylesterase